MPILALETSTELGSAALWINGRIVERLCPAGQSHSATLLPLVRELMADAGLGFAQLEGIAFGTGPGAFTGLRVACGVAQGLAVGADLPVLPVCTLAAVAWQTGQGRIMAAVDARMGEVYSGLFTVTGNEVVGEGELQVGPPGEVPLPEGADWQAGGNALAVYEQLAHRVAAAGVPGHPAVMPLASAVATLAVPCLARGEGLDAALAAPLYIRDKVARTVAERLAEGGKA